MKFLKLFFLTALFSLVAAYAVAQESIYLIKDNQVIGKYSINDVEYITFQLPEGVTEPKSVDVSVVSSTKNTVSYKVTTFEAGTSYVHYLINTRLADYMLQEYYGVTLANASDETLDAALRSVLSEAYLGKGSATYTMKHGEDDGSGTVFNIPAGETFFLIACDLNADASDLGETLSYVKVSTQSPAESSATLQVSYDGLSDDGGSKFSITPSAEITTFYTLYGRKSSLEPYIEQYGYEQTMFVFGEFWTTAEWTENPATWTVDGEDDYQLYVLGIDTNGDWVRTSLTQHIVPATTTDDAPKISVLSSSKGEGAVSVKVEVTPSNVFEAYAILLSENTVESKLNQGYTLAELAAGGSATDITKEINSIGEYTFTASDLDREWKTLLISAKTKTGITTVLRVNFHPFVDSNWDISTTTFGTSSALAPARAKSPAIGSVKVHR